MKYFDTYSSNTCAGSGNQLPFSTRGEVYTGRIFYKIMAGGEHNYSFLFSNTIDSTFNDGSIAHNNLICDSWELLSIRAAICKKCDISDFETPYEGNVEVGDFHAVTVSGSMSVSVMPGMFFATDPVKLNFESGDWLCLEMEYRGDMIPYHDESIIPTFVKKGDGWKHSKDIPYLSMLGCDRPIKKKIGYLGDSITQGIGTSVNSYTHWNALLSDMLGEVYAYWNLGIGFGRADDAASDGAWLFRAKHNDIVVVCYGVNDIMQGFSEQEIIQSFEKLVGYLHKAGAKVLLQTIPPFNPPTEEKRIIFENVNQYLKDVLSKKTEGFFDNVPILQESAELPHLPKYGVHPDETGCKLWANALYPVLKELIEKE